MKSETARWIESTTGKPEGWLDQEHAASAIPDRDQAFINRVEQEVARYDVPEHIRQAVITLITSSPPRQTGSSLEDHPIHEAKAA